MKIARGDRETELRGDEFDNRMALNLERRPDWLAQYAKGTGKINALNWWPDKENMFDRGNMEEDGK